MSWQPIETAPKDGKQHHPRYHYSYCSGVGDMTPEQEAQVRQLKSYFPYRIAYGALNEESGEFIASAVPTKCIPNKLARDGWRVWLI